jgi:signal transduction histidine kinase
MAVTGKRYHHISVTDNGIGFLPEYNTLIFDVFQRLHGRSEYEGTGLGLAICKRIVENHYGIILASGQPDKGAVFHIYLPA